MEDDSASLIYTNNNMKLPVEKAVNNFDQKLFYKEYLVNKWFYHWNPKKKCNCSDIRFWSKNIELQIVRYLWVILKGSWHVHVESQYTLYAC